VALGALCSHIRKHGFDMALRAHQALVHSAERKLGLVMIKFGNATNRFPSQRSVAISAWQIQRAVRTPRLRVHLRLPLRYTASDKEQKQIDQNGRDHPA
jgi:hypothetical protein